MASKASPQNIPRLTRTIPPPSTSASSRWQTVVTRDPTATTFVYAVLTTKIYCRPSCPSRLARRANVDFYDTPLQAERAGFRPCKRCHPETLNPAINPHIPLVQRACQTIKSDIVSGHKPTLTKIAGEAGLTPSHFHRVFKKVMGVTPGKYAAGVLREVQGEGEDGKGLDGSENQNLTRFQPLGQHCGDLDVGDESDSWLMGELDWDASGGTVGAERDDAVLWNDFDVLIAAEAKYASRQDLGLLPGGAEWSGSGSSNPGVVEGDFSFAGVKARGVSLGIPSSTAGCWRG